MINIKKGRPTAGLDGQRSMFKAGSWLDRQNTLHYRGNPNAVRNDDSVPPMIRSDRRRQVMQGQEMNVMLVAFHWERCHGFVLS